MVRYKGGKVVSIRKHSDPTEFYGYVVVDRLFRPQKVYQVDKNTYAEIAMPLLFERFNKWLKTINGFDGLTVQLSVEIRRAGLSIPDNEIKEDFRYIGVDI